MVPLLCRKDWPYDEPGAVERAHGPNDSYWLRSSHSVRWERAANASRLGQASQNANPGITASSEQPGSRAGRDSTSAAE